MSTLSIDLQIDGDQWCALIGPNIQEGEAGFGATPNEAVLDLVSSATRNGTDVLYWAAEEA